MPPKTISPSQCNTYLSCPYKYYLQYILGIKSPVTSPHLEFGSKIHDMIARQDFSSVDPIEQEMLLRAKKFLTKMPPNPIFETKYSDGDKNPGRFYGNVLGQRAISVFDVHWVEDPNAIDWKTGAFYSTYTEHFEVQGYFLNELYWQKYDKSLKNIYFKFLKDDSEYVAKVVNDTKTKTKIEKTIRGVLYSIEEGEYPKKCGKLCSFCDYSSVCSLNL